MKKTKVLAFALSAAIIVMGAGYAAWSETVTINNTVQTGDLKVEFIDNVKHPLAGSFNNKGSNPNFINTSIVQDNGQLTTVKVGNMYPGSTAFFETRIENLGSIPANFDSVKVDFTSDTSDVFKNNVWVYGQIKQFRPVPGKDPIQVASIKIKEGKLIDLQNILTTALQGIQLMPGDYITFDADDDYKAELATKLELENYDLSSINCLYFNLPLKTAGNDTENQKAQFDIAIKFKQFNK